MALWSGRFEQGVSEFTQRFGASLPVDRKMYRQDIAGSVAHARMLSEQGIISTDDFEAIKKGLGSIRDRMDAGTFEFDVNDEDIHMTVEKALTADVGAPGARLHTGRSRNDQVATDTRLHAKALLDMLMRQNCALRRTILRAARKNVGVVMPGYTHMQHAQPVLFSHHLLAYFWMFTRDFKRLRDAFAAADANPLGSAALAGTTFDIDRTRTTELLGFDHAIPNSMDAVSDRDYLLDLDYACAVSMMHLSRLSEEVVLWSTTEFGLVTLSDSYSTGSSIMPQKKNPDFAELTRGKTGHVYGDLMALLTTMKSLPLAYNKDLQDAMLRQAGRGFMGATDIADYLARKGMPFREAHEVVGEMVLFCEKHGIGLEDLSAHELRSFSPLLGEDILDALDSAGIVEARQTYGGTSTASVKAQLEEASAALRRDRRVARISADHDAVPGDGE